MHLFLISLKGKAQQFTFAANNIQVFIQVCILFVHLCWVLLSLWI